MRHRTRRASRVAAICAIEAGCCSSRIAAWQSRPGIYKYAIIELSIVAPADTSITLKQRKQTMGGRIGTRKMQLRSLPRAGLPKLWFLARLLLTDVNRSPSDWIIST